MSSWSNAQDYDNGNTSATLWQLVVSQRNYRQTMHLQSANRTNLFEDNTADEFISGMTVWFIQLQCF